MLLLGLFHMLTFLSCSIPAFILLPALLPILTAPFLPCRPLSPFPPSTLKAVAEQQGAAAGQQRRGGEGPRQQQGKQSSRSAAAEAAAAVAAVGTGGLEGRLGYGKLIPSSLSLPLLQAEGGNTGARTGEWSLPSYSPPPLSLLPPFPPSSTLPGSQRSPVPPSNHPPSFPAASTSWRSAWLW
ncbi:unnamed protein product [Closterium sp. NIES-54]